MKDVIKTRRAAGIALFVSGVVLYFLFTSFHPLLHNHHADGRHHPNCPICNFLLTATFSDIPEIVTVPAISYRVAAFVILLDYHQPYQQLFYDCHSIRGPPINFA